MMTWIHGYLWLACCCSIFSLILASNLAAAATNLNGTTKDGAGEGAMSKYEEFCDLVQALDQKSLTIKLPVVCHAKVPIMKIEITFKIAE